MSCSLRARLLATTCALLSAGAGLPAAAATNIGVTSAVVPAARGTPTEGDTRVLHVGLDMQANERVQTDEDGKAHLLFLDGSALSIGPNSDVVLDEFVYDPESRTGKIALSATRGVFRFVGGHISKTTPVTLTTPTATVGVRGGIVSVTAGGDGVSAAFIYGVGMFVRAQDQVERAERPGSLIRVPPGGAPLPAIPLTTEMVNARNAAFEGGPGEQAGGPEVSDEDVADSQVSALNSTAAIAEIAPAAGGGLGGGTLPPSLPTGDLAEEASRNAQREQVREEAEEPGPMVPPGQFPVQGAYSGRLKRIDALTLQTQDDAPGQNLGFAGDFSAGGFSGQAENGASFVITPDDQQQTSSFFSGVADPQPFGDSPLQAFIIPIFSDPEFLLVELLDSELGESNELPFFFGFAGVPTPTTAVPTSGVGSWLVFDFFQGESSAPFAPPGLGSVVLDGTAQAYAVWNGSAPGASRAFLIPTLAISGQGENQTSITSVVVGQLLDDADDRPFLQARARGVSKDAGGQPAFFGGGVSTSDGGDGSDFFGSAAPDYFVLEASAVDGADEIVDRGIQVLGSNDEPSFPNVYATSTSYTPQTRSTRTLNGFVAGAFGNFDSSGAFTGFGEFRNFTPSETTIATDAATNRVDVMITAATGEESSIDFNLGGASEAGSSAFIDDRLFAAIDRPMPASLLAGFGVASEASTLVTSDAMDLIGALPDGVSLCECRHATWGFLSSRLERADGSRIEVLNAPVVAGQLVDAARYNVTQTASYAGNVFGTVVRGSGPSATSYTAFGNIQLGASFTPGNVSIGSVSVTNFDGGSLSGSGVGSANVNNDFTYQFSLTSNDIPGAGNVTAVGRGTFVGPSASPTTAPLTTIGSISGDNGVAQSYQLQLGYVAEQ